VNVLVRSCSSKFFSIPLPGATMLMLDLIHAASVVLSLPYDFHDFNRYAVSTVTYCLLSKTLLKFSFSYLSIILFSDKSIFRMATSKNPQNHQLYAPEATKKNDIVAIQSTFGKFRGRNVVATFFHTRCIVAQFGVGAPSLVFCAIV